MPVQIPPCLKTTCERVGQFSANFEARVNSEGGTFRVSGLEKWILHSFSVVTKLGFISVDTQLCGVLVDDVGLFPSPPTPPTPLAKP